jgi:DNA-binding transcriptional MocR family regulator
MNTPSHAQAAYDALVAQKLNLDITRGKPCAEQLDLSAAMLTCVSNEDIIAADGTDTRNYGAMDGIPEAKKLFADYLQVGTDEIIIGGNSSLNLMYDYIARAMLLGVPGGAGAWVKQGELKWLCPVPGYDRHFSVTETLGFKLIAVPMTPEGPDMDVVERLVADDASIKGMWSVPKYSNPTGVTFSKDVVTRLAQMKTAAPDFRIIWDNAYAVHHLSDTPDVLEDLLAACKRAGHAERAILIGSTAKVSMAGTGVSMIGASAKNIEVIKKQMNIATIGYDKVNQMRHVRFFRDMQGIEAHMRLHQAILAPKFAAVQRVLTRELGGSGLATWLQPNGGYFVNFDTRPGMAKRVLALCAAAGVKFTPAGSTSPYKNDPADTNIRIAPSFPSVGDIERAMEVLAASVRLAASD